MAARRADRLGGVTQDFVPHRPSASGVSIGDSGRDVPSDAGARAGDVRRAELAARLEAVRAQVDAACRRSGRDPGTVTLVAVTKTYPASDVAHLAALGVTDVGENRDHEAAPKAAAVAQTGSVVRWHFVGQLQRNKCRSVVTYADVVQSVDSVRLVDALAAAAGRYREWPLDVFVQVSLDGDPARGGAVGMPVSGPASQGSTDNDVQLMRVVERVIQVDMLNFCGLMAIAPLGWEPARAFAILADVSAAVRAEYPTATALSAGMSNDFEQAIRYGATHIRVGNALLGNRAPLR